MLIVVCSAVNLCTWLLNSFRRSFNSFIYIFDDFFLLVRRYTKGGPCGGGQGYRDLGMASQRNRGESSKLVRATSAFVSFFINCLKALQFNEGLESLMM